MRPGVHDRRATPVGFTLVEIAVSAAMLATALLIFVQVLALAAAGRRADERRAVATQEVRNLMERIASADWSGGTPGPARDPKPSPRAARLPGVTLGVDVSTPPGDPAARRVAIELRYRNAAGEMEGPPRLVAWFYPGGRAEP